MCRREVSASFWTAACPQGSAPNKVRTSFRKSKEAEPKDGDVDYTKKETEEPESEFAIGVLPLLFVDGYNIIGLWPRLSEGHTISTTSFSRAPPVCCASPTQCRLATRGNRSPTPTADPHV